MARAGGSGGLGGSVAPLLATAKLIASADKVYTFVQQIQPRFSDISYRLFDIIRGEVPVDTQRVLQHASRVLDGAVWSIVSTKGQRTQQTSVCLDSQ